MIICYESICQGQMSDSSFFIIVDRVSLGMNRADVVFDWQEIGWDSEKPGYDGLIDVAHRIMVGRSNSEATEAAVSTFVFPLSSLK